MSIGQGYDSPNPLAGGNSVQNGIKVKLSLRPGQVAPSTPFYTMKHQLPESSPLVGSMDLLEVYDLSNAYNRFCAVSGTGKKTLRDDLNSFLPHLYGNFNVDQGQDISWLKMLVEKPPITGKEIHALNASSIASFKLTPGPVDEPYRSLFDKPREGGGYDDEVKKLGKKYKRSLETVEEENARMLAMDMNSPLAGPSSVAPEEREPEKKKHKEHKDHKEDKEKKAKKKKKEKKNKKEKKDE